MQTNRRSTPLLVALIRKHPAVAEALLTSKQNTTNTKIEDYFLTVVIAGLHGYTDIVKLLLERRSAQEIPPPDFKSLIQAFEDSHDQLDKKFITQHKIGPENLDKFTLLQFFSIKRLLPLVPLLIEKGADVHIKTEDDHTTLHLACCSGNE